MELKRLGARRPRGEDFGFDPILYLIDGDWSPAKPGTDYLGALPHIHVTPDSIDDLLERMQRGGWTMLWSA